MREGNIARRVEKILDDATPTSFSILLNAATCDEARKLLQQPFNYLNKG